MRCATEVPASIGKPIVGAQLGRRKRGSRQEVCHPDANKRFGPGLLLRHDSILQRHSERLLYDHDPQSGYTARRIARGLQLTQAQWVQVADPLSSKKPASIWCNAQRSACAIAPGRTNGPGGCRARGADRRRRT